MEWTYDPITNSSYTDPNTWEIYAKPGNIRDNKDGTKSIYLDNKWRELNPPKWYDLLQEHDWWTLGSIAGDLAGLGLSAAGFTPAATISGILSTGALFVSDIKRDGFQWLDLGSTALGLGLDAATFFTGPLASGLKNSRKIIKYAPWILKTFGYGLGALGATDALNALNHIIETKKCSVDDLRSITNGIMGLMSIKNTYKNSKIPVQSENPAHNLVIPEKEKINYLELLEKGYSTPDSHLEFLQRLEAQRKAKQKLFEATGLSKSERNQVWKPSPLANTRTTSLDHLMLINKVANREGNLQFQNGYLIWPHRKLKGLSLYDGSTYTFDRPTVHFTTHQSVQSHSNGNWDGSATTIMFPYKTAVEHNGNPINIDPMDTYWGNATSFLIPSKDIMMFTGDLLQASLARLQGVNVTFSKDVHKLHKELLKIKEELNTLDKKHNYLIPLESSDFKKKEILNAQKEELEKKLRTLHEEFIQSHQTLPTYEDYKTLEKETGLKSLVGTWDNPVGFGERQNGGITYSHDPRSHSNSWMGEVESVTPFNKVKNFLYQLKEYGYDVKNNSYAWIDDYFDDILGINGTYFGDKTKQSVKDTYSILTNKENLVLLQLQVLKCSKEELIQLKEVLKEIPDDIPNVDLLKRILNGERVFKWKFGGTINYLNYFNNE